MVETTRPDQAARPVIRAMKQRQIAPRRIITKIADRLVAEWIAPVFGQRARQIGDLLVGRIVFDGQVQRQRRQQIARGGIVVQRRREILICEIELRRMTFPFRPGTVFGSPRTAEGSARLVIAANSVRRESTVDLCIVSASLLGGERLQQPTAVAD